MRVPAALLRTCPTTLRVAVCTAADGARGLPPAEAAQAAALAHPDRRHGFALGRTAARALLAERLGVAPEAVPLSVAADGAPVVGAPADGAGGLHVSIAHAGRGTAAVAAAAVADLPVGVDVEAIVPRRADLWRRMLHADEHALLAALGGPTDRAQTLLWSLKEAVLKGQRTGLRAGARSVRLALDGVDGEVSPAGTGTALSDVSGRWCVAWADLGGLWLSLAWALPSSPPSR